MQSSFRLVMRTGPSVGKVYPIDKPEIFVGRDLNNDIVINDPEISRRHARLFLQGNAYVLEDLGSTNGTSVNGQHLTGPGLLRPGDSITFGERMNLVFEVAQFDPDATLVSPPAQPPQQAQGAQVYAQPAYQPPAYQAPVQSSRPVENYAGQLPAAYVPEVPPERRFPITWVIIIGVLLLVCLCLVILAWNAPTSFWCLFPVWPQGACP